MDPVISLQRVERYPRDHRPPWAIGQIDKKNCSTEPPQNYIIYKYYGNFIHMYVYLYNYIQTSKMIDIRWYSWDLCVFFSHVWLSHVFHRTPFRFSTQAIGVQQIRWLKKFPTACGPVELLRMWNSRNLRIPWGVLQVNREGNNYFKWIGTI